jgi:ribosome assembly protein 1
MTIAPDTMIFVQCSFEPFPNSQSTDDLALQHQEALSMLTMPLPSIPLITAQPMQVVMRSWLPLAEAALTMVAHHLPSPVTAAAARMPHLTRSAALSADDQEMLPLAALNQLERTRTALASSRATAEAPTVVYIAKMVAVPAGALPLLPGERPPADLHADEFLAFGRVFCGVLREGQRVHVLSAAYSPLQPDRHRCVTTSQ